MSDTYHILPVNDSYSHVEAIYCECCPARHPEQFNLIIHNAFDSRELRERIQALKEKTYE